MEKVETRTEKCVNQAVINIDKLASEAARILNKHCGTFTADQLLNLVDKLQGESRQMREYL